jgi:hypothetical protein
VPRKAVVDLAEIDRRIDQRDAKLKEREAVAWLAPRVARAKGTTVRQAADRVRQRIRQARRSQQGKTPMLHFEGDLVPFDDLTRWAAMVFGLDFGSSTRRKIRDLAMCESNASAAVMQGVLPGTLAEAHDRIRELRRSLHQAEERSEVAELRIRTKLRGPSGTDAKKK